MILIFVRICTIIFCYTTYNYFKTYHTEKVDLSESLLNIGKIALGE